MRFSRNPLRELARSVFTKWGRFLPLAVLARPCAKIGVVDVRRTTFAAPALWGNWHGRCENLATFSTSAKVSDVQNLELFADFCVTLRGAASKKTNLFCLLKCRRGLLRIRMRANFANCGLVPLFEVPRTTLQGSARAFAGVRRGAKSACFCAKAGVLSRAGQLAKTTSTEQLAQSNLRRALAQSNFQRQSNLRETALHRATCTAHLRSTLAQSNLHRALAQHTAAAHLRKVTWTEHLSKFHRYWRRANAHERLSLKNSLCCALAGLHITHESQDRIYQLTRWL